MKEYASIKKIKIAATECFSEKGYAKTTIRDIAERAGVSQGTIYLHFKGKQELFQELNLSLDEKYRPDLEAKQKELVRTALLMFGERGYNGVTMDDIAKAMSVSKATLYKYCQNKEDLFSMVLHSSEFNLYTEEIIEEGQHFNIVEAIKEVGRRYLDIGKSPERSALLKSVIRDSEQFPALGTLYFEQGIRPACNNIIRFIQLYGKNNHRAAIKDESLYKFVLSFVGSLQSYVMMNDIVSGIKNSIDREEYLENTTKIFVNYLKINDYI